MATLADEIAKLADPTPKFVDPEDDTDIETAARVVERFDESSDIHPEVSKLRQKNTILLEETDARYTGKKISRESFSPDYVPDSESSSGDEESEDDNATDEGLKSFKQQILGSSDLQNRISQALHDSNSSKFSNESEEDDFSERREMSAESDEEQETEDDILKKFSSIDVNEEIEKGKAVESQLGLWSKFCESRIRFQKIIISINQLPQFDVWSDFKNRGDESYLNALERAPCVIKSLLDSMLEIQYQLLLNNPETKHFITIADGPSTQENNEEISSLSESENEETTVHSRKNTLKEKCNKRKWKLDGYDNILAKRFKAFVPYRNSVIQQWDDKTRLITGSISQKSFNAFSQPALTQINQILQDKQRLIQRTQLKRSIYRILGKHEANETNLQQSEKKCEAVDRHSGRNEHLSCHDSEIFDDDDFYRLLLKDVIETKSVGMDPDILRTHMEIQKNRRKMKKKVDTKASKGRKIRCDPHAKMMNFLACVNTEFPERTRTDVWKRMFRPSPVIHAQ